MAPKDEHASKNIPQGLNHESQESSFDESSNSSTCATDNEKQDRGWKRRLLLQIKTLMWGVKGGGNSESLASQFISKYGSRAILGIAVVFIYKLASPRIKRRLWPFLLAMSQNQEYHKAVQVSLSLLRSAALNGSVTRALVGSDEIMFQERLTKQWKRSKLPSNSPNLQSDLVELLARNGCDNVSTLPETFWSRASPVLLTALPFVYLAMVYKIFKNMHNDGGNSASRLLNNASQTTRFTDIAGLDPIIAEVQDIVSYLRNPSSYLQVGAHPPRGILLHGLPGSGKTLLAQALAGEGNCDTFITCSGSDFCEMYVGRGAARVRSLFERARSMAIRKHQGALSWLSSFGVHAKNLTRDKRPPIAIIFIDELDALAKSRSSGITSNDEREQTLNQLLTEMDGFASSSETTTTIIVIAATNRADVLDPAILRRFDRQIHVPYPDQFGRRDILKIHARKIICNIDQINWEHLASHEMTGRFSGSDLRNVVNDAALLAVRDKSRSVRQTHFDHAIRRARAMKVNTSSMGGSKLW